MEDNLQNEDICQKYYSYNFLFKINCLNLRHIATCKFFLDEDEFNKIKKFLNNNNCDPYKLIIDSIIQIDPSLERLFNNPQKLGKLKYIVIQNLIKYIKQKNEETNKNNDQIMKEIKNKLDKIKRIFSSCDYSIIDRRSLFLDQYLPERDSKYKLFVDEIIKLTQSKNININEATELVVRRDFEEILVLSGSEELKKYYLRRLEMPIKKYKTSGLEGITQDLSSFFFGENGEFFEDDNIDYNIDKEEELKIKSNLKRMKEVVIEADKYNRELYENLKQAKTKEDFVDLAIPFETSVSQVGPPDVTLSILDTGTLCDALLGEMAFFQENNFGSHVCTTKKIQKLSNKNLSERLQSYGNPHGHNVNRIYGKILINDNVIYGLNGDKNSSFSMGIAHQCIHLGIPSTEITAIIINNRGSIDFNDLLNSQKKAIAINGFFIPVIHEMTEKILFSPEEFDQMKVFYHDLYYKGYSMDIIDAVYSYYLKPSVPESNSIVVKSPKHKIVMDAAFEYEKNNPDQKLFDMVQLVEFLNTNHLNTKSTDWYEKNSHNFPELLKSVKEFTLDKRIKSIKETFFIKRSAPGKRVEVNPDNKIMKKFIRQLEDLGISKGSKNYYKYLDIVNQILFRKFKKNSEKLDIQSIIKIQKTLINTKKRSLRNIWGRMCKKYPNYEKYKDKICPMFTGSIGRMESGFDSDNDFVIVVDDRNMTQDQISEVSNIIEKIILNIRDNWEGSGGIDFGKFNKGGKGIVPMTKISSFSLDLNNFSGFHEIEPTSMSSTCPFFKDLTGIYKIVHMILKVFILFNFKFLANF